MSVFFHIDLDAFFASVEQVDHPEYAGKPVIVGAMPGARGVVSTCSYEARSYGVRSAMPISEAARLCPHAVFLPVRMSRYAELSRRVMNIFETFTPDYIQVSIDEASLDMTGTERLWGEARAAAVRMRDSVAAETGLSISIGCAPNRYVAKIASGIHKPHGLTIIEKGGEAAFMEQLSLKDVWGLGKKTQARLASFGIHSVRMLVSMSREALSSIAGEAGGLFIYKAVRGIDPGIYGEAKSRSLGSEITFAHDSVDRTHIEDTLLSMAEELLARLYTEHKTARCVSVKLRYDDFETISIQETRSDPYTSSLDLYRAALSLLDKRWSGRPLRLIGLSLSALSDASCAQGSLFNMKSDKDAKVEEAVMKAGMRGLGKITKARLVRPD